ncbi:GntR family transcriptional regulator [Luteococcus sp. Sow4_B9]|uniref:GntR family transcriptional regulator n=1 Tax=Luteococcus sp. Sow4_B9 TaxID=3438792 RepID=UPI003F9BC66E
MRPLDPNDSRPPYLQLSDRIREAIEDGEWSPGERLPSIKELAESTQLATVTVQQALKPLKSEGLVVSRQGSGNYVRSTDAIGPDLAAALATELSQGGKEPIRYVGRTGQPFLMLAPMNPKKVSVQRAPSVVELLVTHPAPQLREQLEARFGPGVLVRVHRARYLPDFAAVQTSRNGFFMAPDGEDSLLNPRSVWHFSTAPGADMFTKWFRDRSQH